MKVYLEDVDQENDGYCHVHMNSDRVGLGLAVPIAKDRIIMKQHYYFMK